MIEKPKRPKKPDIQERQPPRTLQELVNRYDLDNTKVYDFLDELVELLNTERKSIDTSINDLNNNKVNKSGDEMTGQLNMQSNPLRFGTSGNIFWKEDGFGNKFRILPYFSGSGSSNKLVIQSTNGDAGTDPQNWKDLVYIHADTGLIELAGRLLFNNKDSYDAIRKIRTINNTDYGVSVGVGANGSARMEYYTGPNTLGSVEARSDGIYNGVSGKRLAEQESSKVNITARVGTLGANTSYKIGNVVGLNARFDGVTVSAGSTAVLCTLPSGYYNTTTQMQVVIWANNSLVHCWIRTNGEVVIVPPSNLNNAEVRMVGSFIV